MAIVAREPFNMKQKLRRAAWGPDEVEQGLGRTALGLPGKNYGGSGGQGWNQVTREQTVGTQET